TGVTLAPGAAAQLVVDAARLLALGAEDVEAAGVQHLLPVGLDPLLERREDLVPVLVPLLADRLDAELYELDVGLVLGVPATLDVDAADRQLGRDRDALLGLDRLVQALGPAPALEDAAGELVDDANLAVDHRVVDVALVERLCLERLNQVVDQVAVLGAVHVVDAEELLGLRHSLLGDGNGLVLLIGLVVEVGDPVLLLRLERLWLLAGHQLRRELRERVVEVGGLLRLTRDD